MKSAEERRNRTSGNISRGGGWLMVLLLGLILIPASHALTTELPELKPSIEVSARQTRLLEKKYGIQLMSLRLSSAGHMLDFRYRILDPEKAKYLMNKDLKPYVLDPETDKKFFVPSHPKVGSLRAVSVEPKLGRSYYILFSNTNGWMKTGKKVTVVIGDLKIKGLEIQ